MSITKAAFLPGQIAVKQRSSFLQPPALEIELVIGVRWLRQGLVFWSYSFLCVIATVALLTACEGEGDGD